MAGGRPTKQTPEVVERLKTLIGLGMTRERAAMACHISKATLYSWMKDPEFLDALKEAEALGESECLDAVRKGAQGWQGSAWILERRHHRRWKKRDERTVIKDPIDSMQADELLKWLADVAKKEGIK